jgi:hypothetical protein
MSNLEQFTDLELAQVLAERMGIQPNDWHRLKGDRSAQAKQQIIAGLIFLLKGEQSESLIRLQQATAWLDRSISAPPCPTHGPKKN